MAGESGGFWQNFGGFWHIFWRLFQDQQPNHQVFTSSLQINRKTLNNFVKRSLFRMRNRFRRWNSRNISRFRIKLWNFKSNHQSSIEKLNLALMINFEHWSVNSDFVDKIPRKTLKPFLDSRYRHKISTCHKNFDFFDLIDCWPNQKPQNHQSNW